MKKGVKVGEYAEIKDKVAWLRKYSDRHFPLEGQPSLLQHAITLIDIIEKQREELKFYGDEENYISPPISQYGSKEAPAIKLDRGQRARSILKLTEE